LKPQLGSRRQLGWAVDFIVDLLSHFLNDPARSREAGCGVTK
jgi:hypothetical protein